MKTLILMVFLGLTSCGTGGVGERVCKEYCQASGATSYTVKRGTIDCYCIFSLEKTK